LVFDANAILVLVHIGSVWLLLYMKTESSLFKFL